MLSYITIAVLDFISQIHYPLLSLCKHNVHYIYSELWKKSDWISTIPLKKWSNTKLQFRQTEKARHHLLIHIYKVCVYLFVGIIFAYLHAFFGSLLQCFCAVDHLLNISVFSAVTSLGLFSLSVQSGCALLVILTTQSFFYLHINPCLWCRKCKMPLLRRSFQKLSL